jgi:ABC-type sugar transport system ATPase subunit
MSTDTAGVRIRGLSKRYGDTVALDRLDLDARPGEILGVAGPNGAGKSTMVKILAAEVDGYEGEILIDGEPWSPGVGSNRVAVVHQELQLFPNLTVAENIVVGRESSSWRRPRIDASHELVLEELGISRELRDALLGGCGLAIQQRAEITRALVRDARVMLFDEPNSALTPEESAEFFRLIRQLADSGRVVMLISHRLTELAANSDRVAIIMDGRCVRQLEGADRTAENIAETLVRGLDATSGIQGRIPLPDEESSGGLRVAGLTDAQGAFADLELSVPQGVVTALVGVEGSGAREIVRAAAGLRRVSGQTFVGDQSIGPARLGSRVAYVAADRASSLFSNLTVGENLVIRLDREISRGVLGLKPKKMRAVAETLRTNFQVKASALDMGIRALSGGNQQKVAIAAAVGAGPNVLALEEPTRGVDISSKAEIYGILRDFAAQGGAVLLFCTEIPEVYEVADRLHVVSDGRLSPRLDVSSFPDMEALAKAVASLESHGRLPQREPIADDGGNGA